MGGWVKLYRVLLEKPIWHQSTPEQKAILITLLLMANHEPCEWEWRGKKFVVQPGQFVTSLPAIQQKCGKGISIRNVRTALERFQKLEFLTDESSETGRLISIVNWAQYQGGNDEPDRLTDRPNGDNRQSTDRRVTANKNDKNDKKEEEGSSSRLIFTDETMEMTLARHLRQRILENLPTAKVPEDTPAKMQPWCKQVDLMLRLDKRDPAEVREVIDWCQSDPFWRSNILSPKTLREKYDRLAIKMRGGPKPRAPTTNTQQALEAARRFFEEVQNDER